MSPFAVGKKLFVQVRGRPGPKKKSEPIDWLLFEKASAEIELSLPEMAGGAKARAFLLPRTTRWQRTRPVRVRSGMVLQGGLAVHPVVPSEMSAPIGFAIHARVGDQDSELLYQEVVSPKDGAPHWIDYALDLERFAGQEVSFDYVTAFDGAPEAGALGVPLWSRAILLEPTDDPGWNFLVVSLDTLRADHLGAYGASGNASPVVDAFAGEGTLFEGATTTFPSTAASHMSMLTGLYPTVHRVRAPGVGLSRKIPTLAELLASAGYRTAAVTENGMIAAAAGFQRGFDSYVEFKDAMPAAPSGHVEQVVDTAVDWLEDHRSERFFLFLHTYQVHGPYNPPAEYDRFLEEESIDPAFRALHASYRGEVLYTDHELRRLFDALDALQLKESTVVVVTADHGEGFGEQGVFGHSHDLTQELMHVPLIVRAPGLTPRSSRVSGAVSLVDLAPTLLDLAGLSPPPGMQGRALTAHLSGDDGSADVPVYSEVPAKGERVLAAREGDTKWLFRSDDVAPQVFDVSGERTWSWMSCRPSSWRTAVCFSNGSTRAQAGAGRGTEGKEPPRSGSTTRPGTSFASSGTSTEGSGWPRRRRGCSSVRRGPGRPRRPRLSGGAPRARSPSARSGVGASRLR